jgi:hypothetical protein
MLTSTYGTAIDANTLVVNRVKHFQSSHPCPFQMSGREDSFMGIVVRLPTCEEFKLPKMWYFVASHELIDGPELPELLLQEVVCLDRFPEMIVLDFGPQFALTFCGQICQCPGIDQRL